MIWRVELKGLLRIYVLWMGAFLAFHFIWFLLAKDFGKVAENFIRGALGFSVFMGAVMIIVRLLARLLGRLK